MRAAVRDQAQGLQHIADTGRRKDLLNQHHSFEQIGVVQRPPAARYHTVKEPIGHRPRWSPNLDVLAHHVEADLVAPTMRREIFGEPQCIGALVARCPLALVVRGGSWIAPAALRRIWNWLTILPHQTDLWLIASPTCDIITLGHDRFPCDGSSSPTLPGASVTTKRETAASVPGGGCRLLDLYVEHVDLVPRRLAGDQVPNPLVKSFVVPDINIVGDQQRQVQQRGHWRAWVDGEE